MHLEEIHKPLLSMGDMMNNYKVISQAILKENSYFHRFLTDFYGEKISILIIKLLTQGFIESSEYTYLKKIPGNIFNKTFCGKIDVNTLNKDSDFKFTPDILNTFLGEANIEFEGKMLQYKVYEVLKQNTLPPNLKLTAQGKGFQIFLEEENDTFYLSIEGQIYIDAEQFWEEKEEGVFLTQILFSGDGKTFVYHLENKIFDTFLGDLEDNFEIEGQTYIHVGRKNNTLIYCLNDGFAIHGNFIYRSFLETSDDILFLTSNYKVSKSGKKRSYIEIFSKNYTQKILDFEGELIQAIEHASGTYISYLQEENIQSEFGIQHVYYIICSRIDEIGFDYSLTQVLKTPQKVQKYIVSGQKESFARMNVQLLVTENDIYVLIAFFTGDTKRDTPLYNLVSLNGGKSITAINAIKSLVNTDTNIEIEYTDDDGNHHTFDSGNNNHQKYLQ